MPVKRRISNQREGAITPSIVALYRRALGDSDELRQPLTL